jgi:alanine racemase
VGYGSAFTAAGPMRIGIVACGYADGYPRHAPTGTPVLVDGVRTRTVGRVSMDMITVDLTQVPQAGIGSEVTLWGEGPRGRAAAHRRGGPGRRHRSATS